MPRSLAVVLFALALAVLVSPSAMAASAGAEETPDPPPVFTLKGSGGYSITGFIGGPQSGPPRLALFAMGRHGGVTYSSFPANYDEETGAIASDLGALGSVDLVFRASGGTERVRSRCGGDPFAYPGGAFVGEVVFDGEEGYTHVDAARAKLDAGFLVNFLCGTYSEGRGGAEGPGASLIARRREGSSYVMFEAIKNAPSKPALVKAELHERSGSLSVSRAVGARAGSGAFLYPPTLESALVTPPRPFSGSARFAAGTAGGSWLGSLSVDFPGRSGVPLVGPDFHVSLAHADYSYSSR